MKKNLIIWGAALILVLVAVYTVNNHNKTTAVNPAPTQTADASASVPPSPQTDADSPSSTESANTSQAVSTTPTPDLSVDSTKTPDHTKAPGATSSATMSPNAATNSPAATASTAPSATSTPASAVNPLDFTLNDIDGNKVSLSDFIGKKVFLNFWATWCPPCRGEMPDIEKIYQENKNNEDFVILTVNLGEDSNTVKAFLKKNNYNFRVLLDTDNEIADRYSISAIPTSIFIDENGNIAGQKVGGMTEKQMREFIKSPN